jgi:hypothetical protein
MLLVDAVGDQRVARRSGHGDRTAQKPFVNGFGPQAGGQPPLEFRVVDLAAQLRGVQRIAGQHMQDLQPIGVA